MSPTFGSVRGPRKHWLLPSEPPRVACGVKSQHISALRSAVTCKRCQKVWRRKPLTRHDAAVADERVPMDAAADGTLEASKVSQHTPGPWKAETSFSSKDWGVSIVAPTGASNIRIADMPLRFKGHGPQSGHATQELQWANARLIAQAPAMLDLLQRTYGRCHDSACQSENCAIGRAILRAVEGENHD